VHRWLERQFEKNPIEFAVILVLLMSIGLVIVPKPPGPIDCEGAYVRLRDDNTWECHDPS